MVANADTCVCCGKIITEGYGLTCYECNTKSHTHNASLYDDIRNKLTDFEHCTDKEATDSDWIDEFYFLLVKVQNAFECGDIKHIEAW